MTDVRIKAGALLANHEERTLSGLVVPFEELGNTNLGRFTVQPGSLTIPTDPSIVSLNLEHDPQRPVGRAVSLSEEADGIHGVFKFADTEEASDALLACESGERKALSVEAKHVVIRDGVARAGSIFGASIVAKGAFPSATLMAADIGDDFSSDEVSDKSLSPVDGHLDIEATETPEDIRVTAPGADGEPETTTFTPKPKTEQDETPVIPNTLNAGDAGHTPAPLCANEAFALFAARASGRASATDLARLDEAITPSTTLFAAASSVKHSGTGAVVSYDSSPQWLGEIWDGLTVQPVISDLLGSKALTSRTVAGFKFTTRPTGGTWAGNGAAVPSGPIATTPYSYAATYWAGANTFSREFVDFGVDAELMSWYFRTQAENFAAWLDDIALTGITSGAQAITADNPAGLTIGAEFSALIDGVSQTIANRAGVPTFALVKASAYKKMLKVPQNNVLGYLTAALGLDEGSLSGFQIRPVPDAQLGANTVLVGVRSGADLYTLAGSPFRAEAIQVGTGQIDVGLYGYGLFVPAKPDAFVAVKPFGA